METRRREKLHAKILKKKSSSDRLIRMRTRTTRTIKTSAIIDAEVFLLTPPSKKRFAQHLKNNIAVIPSYRPVKKIEETSCNNSPLVVSTPQGTRMTRRTKLGPISLFSNQSPPPKKSPVLLDQKAIASNNQVKKNTQKVKCQSVLVTEALLEETQAEIRSKHGRRSCSQNKVMSNGVSETKSGATQYVNSISTFNDDIKREWLHLVAYFVLGSKSQDEKNLGAGTVHANTDMLFIESQFPKLAQAYPEGFKLDVQGHFFEGTQILKEIIYTITTKDFILPFVFDAQKNNIPNLSDHSYVNAVVTTLLDIKGKSLDEQEPTSCPSRKKRLSF